MTPIVLDASAALSLLVPTQATEASDQFFAGRSRWRFVAPYVFEWEVRNTVLRRRSTVDLAERLALSLFDAAYFGLAIDREWPVASRDGQLLAAVHDHGMPVYDLR